MIEPVYRKNQYLKRKGLKNYCLSNFRQVTNDKLLIYLAKYTINIGEKMRSNSVSKKKTKSKKEGR